MPSYRTEDIRNIALVGHAGAGKTSLTEALLYRAGAVASAGSVERGDTVSDFDPLEQRHHHSLNPTLAALDHQGRHINLIDTPGYADFLGPTLGALSAVDTVMVVINAQAGIEPMTRRMMGVAAEQRLCRMIVVNKIDAEPDALAGLLEELRATFGSECLALNLPDRHASRVVDCLSREAGSADFASVAEAHTRLLDQVVEVDETLMERYLESGSIGPGELHTPFEQALRDGHLIPVLFASARAGTGVPELLDVLSQWAPSPLEANPRPFVDGAEGDGQPLTPAQAADQPLLARVFKLEFDPFAGRLGVFRVYQGTVRKGDQVLIDDGGKSFKVGHLFRMQGKEHLEVDEAIPGDLCAVAKVEELHYDAILHASHDADRVHAGAVRFPDPLVGLALVPKSRGDEQKISDILGRLAAEDPCLRVEHDMTANETVLRGLGDLHLRVALERMDERYHVQVDTHPPSVPYRETISRPASGHFRHKKQTGGAGQFGEVHLEVEPLEPGSGFQFVNRITGGVIPGQFIPAVEKGIRQVLGSGAVAGYPMQDLRAIVTDGKHHPVDSKEIAFVIAGRKAFLDAVAKAAPVVLEPYVDVEVTVPGAVVGDVTADLSARRARINGSETHGRGQMTISAQAPLAELDGYASRLKSLSGGEGGWSLQFSHYEPAPPAVQKALCAQYRPAKEA
ncbi:MAG: elongation factor G [Gammaproteobacteria bacterium]